MREEKNTGRALVRIGYDGSVHKFFRAANARDRFENEMRVLLYLEERGCDFVPRVIGFDRDKLELVTTNCGARVQQLGEERMAELFGELERFGVRHDDPFLRNVTYRPSDGRFCVIDFEFATILDDPREVESKLAAVAGRNADAAWPIGIPPASIRWSGITDRGRFRANNEDIFLAIAFNTRDFHHLGKTGERSADGLDFVFAVSDGMGGERSGEFASRFTADNIVKLLPRRFQVPPEHQRAAIQDCLRNLFQATHRQLTNLSRSDAEGRNMGATLSVLWCVGARAHFGHIGDTRIYHLPRAGGMRQLTEDHTHVGWLRRRGELNEREARNHPRKNVLSQALGAGNRFVRPQFGDVPCEAGDRFLLCSDGVVEGLWDRALEELLREPPGASVATPPACRIVESAVAESGRDNATAVVVEVLGSAAISEALPTGLEQLG